MPRNGERTYLDMQKVHRNELKSTQRPRNWINLVRPCIYSLAWPLVNVPGRLGKDLRRVGLSTFNDILNAVAPPISEHEVIQVWLSHDMQGLDGVETLVYSALTRVCLMCYVSLTCLMLSFLDPGAGGGRRPGR